MSLRYWGVIGLAVFLDDLLSELLLAQLLLLARGRDQTTKRRQVERHDFSQMHVQVTYVN